MLSPSAHTDTFCRDHLPPETQWPELIFELPELRYPDRLNCATALLDAAVASHGRARPCLHTPDESWSYGELLDRANQIAHVLTDDLGLVPGNRVLLRAPNTPWLVACWFAVIKAGGVVVTTMPLLRASELTTLIELTRPRLALCDHRLTEDPAAADPTLPIVPVGGPTEADLTRRIATHPTRFDDVATAADDVVLLAPTSGTTGVPKATMHFHRDVLANADTFAAHILAPRADDVFIGTPPLAFTFGLGGLVVFPLRVGASTVLLERPDPDTLLDAIENFSATVLFTAPTAYRALLKRDQPTRLRSLRRCVSAGEHLPAPVYHRFLEQTGLKIINGIGGTELLHIFISAADDDIRPGATGRAVPGYRAQIQDESGRPVPDGTPGFLAVKGPTGCRYLADPRQRDYVRDGWNITGDTYLRDADGYFWYQARSDDMIVSAGYNIAAPEVEAVLEQHPDVVECAVIGIPDPERGMIVHAAVVVGPGVPRDADQARRLQEYVKGVAAPYKYPRSIEFLDELPRNPSGKLQRYKLRERWRTACESR
ncbi:AMP-binding protein [Nocardia sp. CDC159]|uniref:AMP-binding protein n=1 Tax=Nocardia pulmonis TaxID=2951408 RepID=A0A9X2E680_9NOCA|nr:MULTISPECIES: AMP-binding protein [Nocardia]MCM6773595.1 AMP-binding protein [Nocardia pulmonis]MCM6786482.1 AMP-binding protein [Nocardia sp. CDC159]